MINKKLFFISWLLLDFATVYTADQAENVAHIQRPSQHIIAQLPDAKTVFLQVRTDRVENDTGQQSNFILGTVMGALQHGLATVIAQPLHSILIEFNSNLFATEAELTEEKKKKESEQQVNVILNEHNSLATHMELLAGKQKIIEKYKNLPNHNQTVLAKLEGELSGVTKELEALLSNDLDTFHTYVKSLRSTAQPKENGTQKK